MKPEYKFVSIVFSVILVFNLFSVVHDDDLLSDFKDLDEEKFKKVTIITVGKVFSNSFFFTSKKALDLRTNKYYMMRHLQENDIVYFKVNTIKHKDTLYFFQHIDWLTKKSTKIKSGKYELQVSN